MTDSYQPSRTMSEDDAKNEHDDIQREIAKSKGQEYKPDEEAKPEEKEEEKEIPEAVDEPKEPKEEPKDDDKDATEEDEIDAESDESKPRKKSLLGKYQQEKHDREAAETLLAEKEESIKKLTAELNRTKTADQMKDKVKVYAEKHGMTEEAALDLILLAKESIQPDEETIKVLEQSKILIKKNEATQQFETEFAGLLSEVPEANELRDKIRAEAYKPSNLDKSLFELYHRVKAAVPTPPKKKGGEVSRGAPGRDAQKSVFDVNAVAEKVKKGDAKPFEGLTNEQIDQVFSHLDKQGSRYQ